VLIEGIDLCFYLKSQIHITFKKYISKLNLPGTGFLTGSGESTEEVSLEVVPSAK
jgi:hypothetical protein